ncbi:hypothetical protein EV644_12956 [Kribbella orskensis]|uniref:Uncharacterized protein n=1 Tax=Kribbella orskensis TaxID=2512216 RepID=A0ABY2BBD7_9ACTN|nr:hypothetical protein EV642_13156 [Kribbella sp. VKM Ac-2500]TCO11688.1 hypothetical protein EV644_12956 [Kribbella orskensis]
MVLLSDARCLSGPTDDASSTWTQRETCETFSLRRYCPDQVAGGRRRSFNRPASQSFDSLARPAGNTYRGRAAPSPTGTKVPNRAGPPASAARRRCDPPQEPPGVWLRHVLGVRHGFGSPPTSRRASESTSSRVAGDGRCRPPGTCSCSGGGNTVSGAELRGYAPSDRPSARAILVTISRSDSALVDWAVRSKVPPPRSHLALSCSVERRWAGRGGGPGTEGGNHVAATASCDCAFADVAGGIGCWAR